MSSPELLPEPFASAWKWSASGADGTFISGMAIRNMGASARGSGPAEEKEVDHQGASLIRPIALRDVLHVQVYVCVWDVKR